MPFRVQMAFDVYDIFWLAIAFHFMFVLSMVDETKMSTRDDQNTWTSLITSDSNIQSISFFHKTACRLSGLCLQSVIALSPTLKSYR